MVFLLSDYLWYSICDNFNVGYSLVRRIYNGYNERKPYGIYRQPG